METTKKLGWRTRKEAGRVLAGFGFTDFSLITRGKPNQRFSGPVAPGVHGTASIGLWGADRFAINLHTGAGPTGGAWATDTDQLREMLGRAPEGDAWNWQPGA